MLHKTFPRIRCISTEEYSIYNVKWQKNCKATCLVQTDFYKYVLKKNSTSIRTGKKQEYVPNC